jgi:ribonuclease HIII
VPHVSHILTNKEYNSKPMNMNAIKAVLHNNVLYDIVNNHNFEYKYIVVDQFCHPRNYFTYLKPFDKKITKITFTTKAEDKCLSVAAASIIGRYMFIKEFKKLEDKYDIFLQKGAGPLVDEQGAELIRRHGKDVLFEVAKLNFKNMEKIEEILKK